MSADAVQMEQGVVGKSGLCKEFGWTRPWLDRRLISDQTFPVRRRGDQSGGWEFVVSDVRPYAKRHGLVKGEIANGSVVSPALDIAQLRDTVAPPLPKVAAYTPRRSADHQGEATARQRKDEAQAALLEERLKVAQGEVMPREDVIALVNESVLYLKDFLDSLPVQLCKRLNLPDAAVTEIATMMEAARKEFVELVRKKFDREDL